MKLLICTQIMDMDDPALGFFHTWVAALAPSFERITVICLKKGNCALPENVQVFSLGKEQGAMSRIAYSAKLIRLAYTHRAEYDRVFVHMNQEYILACGWLWKIMRKPIYLWYNHYTGSFLTNIAAAFCTKVFCTSRFSYTARFKKTTLMPVGVDTTRFTNIQIPRTTNAILSLGRISRSKHIDSCIQAVCAVHAESSCSFSIYGPTVTSDDEQYLQTLHSVAMCAPEAISFHAGVPTVETPAIYAAHGIFINAARSGMYDKTLFEAAASGCLVLAASEDFHLLAGDEYYFDAEKKGDLEEKLLTLLSCSESEQEHMRTHMRSIAEQHSLSALMGALTTELS